MRVAVTTSTFAIHSSEPMELLRQNGLEVVTNSRHRALTADEAGALLQDCQGVAAGTEPLTRDVLDRLPQLRVISRVGVGLDNVDVAYCREKNIRVFNTPFGPTRAVGWSRTAISARGTWTNRAPPMAKR